MFYTVDYVAVRYRDLLTEDELQIARSLFALTQRVPEIRATPPRVSLDVSEFYGFPVTRRFSGESVLTALTSALVFVTDLWEEDNYY